MVVADNSENFNAEEILSLDMLSEAVLYRSPIDRFADPVGLKWDTVTNQGSLQNALISAPVVPSILLCSKCQGVSNPCFYSNTCLEGKCQCDNGATGRLCQLPPVGNGFCDTFFNTPEFKYDGGDCCEATCVSHSNHLCGGRTVGNLSSLSFGFPFCKDPKVLGECRDTRMPCYIPNSEAIPSVASDDVVTALSGNGRILAIAEPVLSTIRVYDNLGGEWLQRGATIRRDSRARLGTSLVLATPSSAIVQNLVGHLPVYVASIAIANAATSSAPSYGHWSLVLHQWDISTLQWEEIEVPSNATFFGEEIRLECGVEWVNSAKKISILVVVDGWSSILYSSDLSSGGWKIHNFSDAGLVALSPHGGIVMTATPYSGRSDYTIDVFDASKAAENGTVSNLLLPTSPSHRIVALDIFDVDLDWLDFVVVAIVINDTDLNVAVNFTRLFLNYNDIRILDSVVSPDGLISFSEGGGTVVISSHDLNGAQVFRTVSFDRDAELARSFHPIYGGFGAVESGLFGSSFAVSNDGLTLVDAASGSSHLYSVSGRCDSKTEQLVRISIIEDFEPVFWTLDFLGFFRGLLVKLELVICRGCRTQDVVDHLVLAEEACIAKNIPSKCMRLWVGAKFVSPSFGLAAFLIRDDDETLLAQVEGQFDDYGFTNNVTATDCFYEARQCEEGYSPLVFANEFGETDEDRSLFFDIYEVGQFGSVEVKFGDHYIFHTADSYCLKSDGQYQLLIQDLSWDAPNATREYVLQFGVNETRGNVTLGNVAFVEFGHIRE